VARVVPNTQRSMVWIQWLWDGPLWEGQSAGQTKRPETMLGPWQNWWRFRDSNPGPADYDSVALTG
jgi:hypothetical protein